MKNKYKLLLIAVLCMTLISGCGKCKNDSTSEAENNVQQTTVEGSVDTENNGNGENNVTENQGSDIEAYLELDESKYTELADTPGVYKINADLDEFYERIIPMDNYIILGKGNEEGTYSDVKIFDPGAAEIIAEHKFEGIPMYQISAKGNKLIVTVPNEKKLQIYNEDLTLYAEYVLPVEKSDVIYVSDNLKYCAVSAYKDEQTFIYTVELEAGEVHEIEGLKKQSSVTSVIYGDVITVACPDYDGKSVLKYYSMEDAGEVDINDFVFNYNISAVGSKYFYYLTNAAKTGVYFGDRGDKAQCIYGLFNEALWDYNNDTFLNYEKDYDNEKVIFSRYSLENGNMVNSWSISNENIGAEGNLNYFILKGYNKAIVWSSDYEYNKTRLLALDLAIEDDGLKDSYEVCRALEVTRTDDGISDELYEKAKLIGDKYGIDIYIGSQCRYQTGWGFDVDILLDETVIDENLDIIDEKLSIYPNDFFEQMKFGSMERLALYIGGNITTTAIGEVDQAAAFADSGSNFLYIVYDGSIKATEATWHEMAHLIDKKIEWTSLQNNLNCMNGWDEYNPEGFEWIDKTGFNDGTGVNYDMYTSVDNMYFVSTYSMVNYLEDRATLADAAIAGEYPFTGEFDMSNQPILEKLRVYSEEIRMCFDTSDWDEVLPWEKPLAE